MARPIRKRGYYRAVQRGEKWAVEIDRIPHGTMKHMMAFYFRTIDDVEWRKMFARQTPILPAKDEGWQGAYIPIPIKLK